MISLNPYTWNPLYNQVMRLRDLYMEKNPTDQGFFLKQEYSTVIDRWIAATQDPYWTDLRPFLHIKQDASVLLFKYADLASIYDLANARGMSSEADLWNHWDGILRYARSITIDVRYGEIVTLPFDKFFNIGEVPDTSWEVVKDLLAHAHTIEYSEKLDGSIFIARYLLPTDDRGGMFFTHSSGSLDAETEILHAARGVFFNILSEESKALRQMVKDNPQQTFMFEFISPINPIVVSYGEEDYGLHLIGIRDMATGDNYTYSAQQSLAKRYPGVRTTRTLDDANLEEILSIIHDTPGDRLEGFVINIDGHLFKLKTDDYVKIHRFIGQHASPNKIIKAIADGEFDDILAKLPESCRGRFTAIAKIIWAWETKHTQMVLQYFNDIPNDIRQDRKSSMIWMEQNVPKEYRGDVRELYIGRPRESYLKMWKGGSQWKYLTISEIDPNYHEEEIEE